MLSALRHYSASHSQVQLSYFLNSSSRSTLRIIKPTFVTATAMPRYKKPASRLKDPSRFQSYHAEEKYEEFIERRKILEEKRF